MAIARPGDTVKVIYSILLENGTTYCPVHSGDTLVFTLGRESVLPGFERAVLGMKKGEIRRVQVCSAEAYGPHRAEKIFTSPRSSILGQARHLGVGDVVRVASADEGEFYAAIRDVNDDDVLLDANHPLCGQDIQFEIHLLDVSRSDSVPPEPILPDLAVEPNGGVFSVSNLSSSTFS